MSAISSKSKLVALTSPNSPEAEAFRTLRANLQFASRERPLSVILVTSSKSGEGKSTTAANLAILYAQAGKKTLLIDANLRKPDLQRYFNFYPQVGLTNLLLDDSEWEQALAEQFYPNLTILTSGMPTSFPSEMLASDPFSRFIQKLRSRFDIILVDSPPALDHSDTQFIASACDGVLLVIQSGRVKQAEARKTLEKLEMAHAEVVGIVLNR